MKSKVTITAVVAVLLMASALTAAASAGVRRGVHSERGFWMVVTPGESFVTAAGQAALARGGSQVAPTIHEMLNRTETGRAVDVPKGTRRRVTNVRATVAELKAALAGVRSLRARRSDPAAARSASRAISPTWEVRGYACNTVDYDNQTWFATWCNLPLELDGVHCDPGCEVVDDLHWQGSTDPATGTSRVGYAITNTVEPGYSSVFTDIMINWNVRCYRNQLECGHADTGPYNPPKDGLLFPKVDSGIDLHNDKVAHLYFLVALFIPNGQNYSDDAITGTAWCEPASSGSNRCLYPSLL